MWSNDLTASFRWSNDLTSIESETQRLEMEWRELQLDYSAFTSGQKIGLTAKEKAKMKLPDSRKINLLKKDETN